MTKKRKLGWIAAIVATIVIIILTNNTTAKKSTFYTIKSFTYKHTKQKDLQLSIYSPKTLSHPTPAIIYFHGGSWISGTRFKIHQRYRQVAIIFAIFATNNKTS